jgi:hypothetical protein
MARCHPQVFRGHEGRNVPQTGDDGERGLPVGERDGAAGDNKGPRCGTSALYCVPTLCVPVAVAAVAVTTVPGRNNVGMSKLVRLRSTHKMSEQNKRCCTLRCGVEPFIVPT